MSDSDKENELLARISELEEQYQAAHAARLQAEHQLKGRSNSASFPAAANANTYGFSDEIEYLDQMPHSRPARRKPRPEECQNYFLNRFCFGYNMSNVMRRPHLHQYVENGKLYREAEERQSSKFELFFDLLFVGVVHQMSDAAAESPTGLGLLKYILTFIPAFSIWSDIRDISNQMGTDDVFQRLYILWIMALQVGYSINAGSVELGILNRSLPDDASADEFQERAISRLALQYCIGFFCAAKLSKVILITYYSYFIPRARVAIWSVAANSGLQCILFFVASFLPIRSMPAVYALIALGIAMEIFLRLLVVLIHKTRERMRGRRMEQDSTQSLQEKRQAEAAAPDYPSIVQDPGKSEGAGARQHGLWSSRIPAYNIEHHVERLSAFVTIVLGEMVANVFYRSTFATGFNKEYGKAILGLMLAFNLNWMYFDSGGAANYIHAIRRHWISGFWFTFLHTPLCAALLLASSSINRFVTSQEVEQGLLWFFGVGIGLSVIIMATIGVLHKALEVPHKTFYARRRFIFATRYAAGTAMVLLPLLRDRLTTLRYMGIYAGITVFLIIEELALRLEKAEEYEDGDESP